MLLKRLSRRWAPFFLGRSHRIRTSSPRDAAGGRVLHRQIESPGLEQLEQRTLLSVAFLDDPANSGKHIVTFAEDTGGTADSLTLRISSIGELEYGLNGVSFTNDLDSAMPGTQSLDVASAISQVNVGLGGGDDVLTIDNSNGLAAPGPAGIIFDGGDGFDTLNFLGGQVTSETYAAGPGEGAGVFTFDGRPVQFLNLEPICDTTIAPSVTYGGTNGADTVTIRDYNSATDGAPCGFATTTITGLGELIKFARKTNVIIDGLSGSDQITLNTTVRAEGLASLTMRGGNQSDSITVISSADGVNYTLEGENGNDTLIGGSAGEVLRGGGGTDRLEGRGGNDTLYGSNSGGVIFGGDGDDVIFAGNGGDNQSFGDAGNDLFVGGTGKDAMYGGDGNDTMSGGLGNDTMDGGAGTDVVDESGDGSFTITTDSITGVVTMNGLGTDRVTTVETFDLSGGDGNNFFDVSGFAGDVTIDAGGGDDVIIGGSTCTGSDLLIGGMGSDSITGGCGGDLIYGGRVSTSGGDGADFIMGGAGDDTIYGGDGADPNLDTTTNTIFGGDGADSIIGGGGSDTIFGGDGADVVNAGAGSDTIYGGDGADALGFSSDTVFGGDGADQIFAGSGADSISGGDGADSIVAGAGSDTIYGGDGADALGSSNDTIFGGDGADQIFAGSGADSISGGDGADSIVAGAGSDTIFGGDGADPLGTTDTIFGGDGADLIFGGDNIAGGDGADFIDAGAGNDTVFGGDGADLGTMSDTVFGGDGADQIFTGAGSDSILGGDGADSIVAGAGSDTIYGGDGADPLGTTDTIFGGDGADIIFGGDNIAGGDGADIISGGLGNDTIYGGDGADALGSSSDTVFGGDGADQIFVGAGSDSISGGDGADSIVAGAGSDTIFGGDGADPLGTTDTIFGGDGADLIFGGDNIAGGDGADFIDAGAGNDTVFGGDGADLGTMNDTVFGGDGADQIFTGAGSDSIFGGDGADSIVAGAGSDTIYGGDGADPFGTTDTIFGGDGADLIFGGDNIAGGDGADIISGGLGNDTIYGGDGADALGSIGDTVFGGDGADQIFVGAGNDSISGGDGADSIVAGAGNDTIFGGDGADPLGTTDTIFGGDGADLIFGGDNIAGGDGADFIDAGSGNDTVFGGDGADLGTMSDTVFGGDGADQIFTGSGADSIFGGDGADFITAGNGSDQISGGDGADLIYAGADSIGGGDGADVVLLGAGNDTVFGGDGADFIDGRVDSSVLGGDGADSIVAGAGDDTVFGGDGADVVIAGAGNDSVMCGDGADNISGGGGANYLNAGDGNDNYAVATGSSNTLTDSSGFDMVSFGEATVPVTFSLAAATTQSVDGSGTTVTLVGTFEGVVGSSLNDTLTGNGLDNVMMGGGGADLVDGGGGDDSIQAGTTQVVFLDFDSNSDSWSRCATATDPVSGALVPDCSTILTAAHSYTAAERQTIRDRIQATYSAFDVQVTLTKPASGDFATLFFNKTPLDNGVPFSGGEGDEFDWRNRHLGGSGSIHVTGLLTRTQVGFEFLGETSENYIAVSTNIAAHEVGHLMGLLHRDAFGPIGSGIFDPPRLFTTTRCDGISKTAHLNQLFCPNYPSDSDHLAAVETGSHVMASPAALHNDVRTWELGTDTFGEREAIKLEFARSGTVTLEQAAGHPSVATAQPIVLVGLPVPNTLPPGAANFGQTFAVRAIDVIGSIGLDASGQSESDFYRFDGHAGDLINVDVFSRALQTSNSIDSVVRIWRLDTDGVTKIPVLYPGSTGDCGLASPCISDDELETQDSTVIDLRLPVDGTYFIEVRPFCTAVGGGCVAADTGDYELFLSSFGIGTSLGLDNVMDTLLGGTGNDTLQGSLGADLLDGGVGSDLAYGRSGDDTFPFSDATSSGSDAVDGGSGTDTLDLRGAPGLAPASIVQTSIEKTNFQRIAGAASTNEGSAYTLTLISGDLAPISWQINWDDGVIETVTGNPTQTTHTYADGPNNYVISATATYSDGTFGALPIAVHVDNVAPVATPIVAAITGSGATAVGVPGQTLAFSSSFSSGSPFDTHTVSWNFGDGTMIVGPTAASPGTIAASHVYTTTGTYTITLTVLDDDGAAAIVSQTISITTVAIETGAICGPGGSTGTALAVGGSNNAATPDNIQVSSVSGSSAIKVSNGAALGSFSTPGGFSRIIIFGQAGDDRVQVVDGISAPSCQFGGEGKDTLNGGGGPNILVGGNGDDVLNGGNGRDILIGGFGQDTLNGNSGDDILVAGYTDHDANDLALSAIMNEWVRTDVAYATRISHILGAGVPANGSAPAGSAGGLNGSYVLRGDYLNGSGVRVVGTSHDDNAKDVLKGDAGVDWFLANLTNTGDSTPGVLDSVFSSSGESSSDLD